MGSYYTTCDEIPLCKFIEMYKGNLNALIKGGRTKPTDGELRKAAMGLIDEYSVITGNKNIAIEIEDRSKLIDCNTKLLMLNMAENLSRSFMYMDAKDILSHLGISLSIEPDNQELEVVYRKIESLRAKVNLNKMMLERNIEASKNVNPDKKNFTRERMIVSAHFKMHINPSEYTASEYGNLIRIMFEQLKDIRNYAGKRD